MSLRVFWPTETLEAERRQQYRPAIVVGWKNGDADVVVVTTLPYLDPALAETLLRRNDLLRGAKHLAPHLRDMCGVDLQVLGTMNCQDTKSELPLRTTFDDSMKYPLHHATALTRRLDSGTSAAIQVIAFDAPRAGRMQYFSLYPVDLALAGRARDAAAVVSEEYEQDLVRRREHALSLREKLREHAHRSGDDDTEKRDIMLHCIKQMNCCHELGQLLRRNAAEMFPRVSALRPRAASTTTSAGSGAISVPGRARRLSVSVVEGAHTVEDGLWVAVDCVWARCAPWLGSTLVALVMVARIIAEAVLCIIDLRVPGIGVPLRELSATAQQIDLRLQQLCYWPTQYVNILKRGRNWSSSTDFNVDYIRFYNSVWLTANDMILGMACGDIVLANQGLIVDTIVWLVEDVLTRRFKTTVLWLMGWPGGLKLNNELAAFCGALFLWVIEFWSVLLAVLRPYLPAFVRLVGYASYLGGTLMVSLVSDLVSFLTLHVYAFYIASARIYHSQLVVLYSLFQLFRGKKRNMLRNRIDSYNYDLDQLLMGTIFFTVLIFLLPTVAVFYLAFAFARLSIVLICASLESLLSFLNHFPLFILLLRAKDYRRVPGGIYLVADTDPTTVERADASYAPPHSFVKLEPLPLSFHDIFRPYRILAERLRMHYQSFSVVTRILTGQFVPIKRSKLYVLLYSSLPEHRLDIATLYTQLRQAAS